MNNLKNTDHVKVTSIEQRHRLIKLAHAAGIPVAGVSDIGGRYGNEVPTYLVYKKNVFDKQGLITGWGAPSVIYGGRELSIDQFIDAMFGVFTNPTELVVPIDSTDVEISLWIGTNLKIVAYKSGASLRFDGASCSQIWMSKSAITKIADSIKEFEH